MSVKLQILLGLCVAWLLIAAWLALLAARAPRMDEPEPPKKKDQ